MIWRDDDIGARNDRDQLLRVDDAFQAVGLPHTVACVMEGLVEKPAIIKAILDRRMVPQLHCWDHEDLTTSPKSLAALGMAIKAMEHLLGVRPTVLYPPWNRTSEPVRQVAAELGLTVSTEKISLSQFLRAGGEVREDTVNFHYWDAEEARQIGEALRLHAFGDLMKITDYAARSAPFDSYIRYLYNARGVEVGVDVGAHAEALLRYCPVAHVTLIDTWPKDYAYGYCEGRLSTWGFRPRFAMIREPSETAVNNFEVGSLDFVYLDQFQGFESVAKDLRLWWPRVKRGGVLGQRNYVAGANDGLVKAADEFAEAHKVEMEVHREPAGEIIFVRR